VAPGATLYAMQQPRHEIRAAHTESTVTVYQAYSPRIGVPAAREGRFPAAWKRDRMTWIKPSFLWMMYRCGWAAKEGQETVLAVEISREGFEWALRNACLSSYQPGVHPDRASSPCPTAPCNSASPARPHAGTPTSGRSPSAT
jgi:hypothetical protein